MGSKINVRMVLEAKLCGFTNNVIAFGNHISKHSVQRVVEKGPRWAFNRRLPLLRRQHRHLRAGKDREILHRLRSREHELQPWQAHPLHTDARAHLRLRMQGDTGPEGKADTQAFEARTAGP